jgi:nitrate/nitrite transporter NarK
MIHALLPVYLVAVLGTSALTVGIIEGIAEATASIIKVFSGALSDWMGKRKFLAAHCAASGLLEGETSSADQSKASDRHCLFVRAWAEDS